MAGEFSKLSFDHRSNILKKYYVNMSEKYLVGAVRCFLFYFWLCLNSFWAVFGLIFEAKTEKFCLGQMSPGFKKANLVSIRKATTESDKNVSTEIVAATFEKEIESEENSGEGVWRNYRCFDARKSEYLIKKVNFPENTLLYINHI